MQLKFMCLNIYHTYTRIRSRENKRKHVIEIVFCFISISQSIAEI